MAEEQEFNLCDGVNYKYNYPQIFRDIVEGKHEKKKMWRYLIKNDLFFLLHFVLKIPNTNNKYVVEYCREIEEGPESFTLDMASREHFKSTCITIGETIQYILKYPNKSTAIFSYIKPAAEDFVFSIKEIAEKNEVLINNFPEVFYKNPTLESPRWSIIAGLVFKRATNRPEPTVAGYGLIDGMPTRVHYDRRIYDDIIAVSFCDNMEMMEKVSSRFDMSQSLGKDGGVHRVLGTPYNFADTVMYVKDKKDVNGKPMYKLRFKPATHDGSITGRPVLLSQEYIDSLKTSKHFTSQYLLDPNPKETKKLNKEYLKIIGPEKLPERLFKFIVIDPSGKKGEGHPWAFMLIGVDPDKDPRASNIYILKLIVDKMPLGEAIRTAVDMYCNSGKVLVIGVEECAQSTTEVHISEALEKKGHTVTVSNGSIQIFKPSGRPKNNRIENISWTLDNGRLYMVNSIPQRYIDRFIAEIDGFPFSNDNDAIDTLSYFILDMLPEYDFPVVRERVELPVCVPMSAYF